MLVWLRSFRIFWSSGIVVACLVVLSGCELSPSATRTPAFTQGSTVFSLVRWQTPDRAIDVVFYPDDDYGDLNNIATRQQFLDDIANLVDEGFWQSNAIVNNIALFNYWFSLNTGDVQPDNDDAGVCPQVTWPDTTDAAFAEVIVLVHPNPLRDCRWGRQSTTEPGSFRTVVHEFSHAAFNLPDEYCCDGGYRDFPPVLYDTSGDCNSDAANSAWRDCDTFNDSDGDNWTRSEDSIIDIMAAGGATVVEYGEGDWAVMESVLGSLSGATVNDPDVFAPDPWDWP